MNIIYHLMFISSISYISLNKQRFLMERSFFGNHIQGTSSPYLYLIGERGHLFVLAKQSSAIMNEQE